jgi:Heavy metal binding domain
MDTVEIFVLVGGLSLIGFVLWFFFGGREAAPKAASGAVVYACPMHPWITSADPAANCSICGMKLVRSEG